MRNDYNAVGWFEIYVDDMDRAKAFYETVLDTELNALPSPDPEIEMLAFPMTCDDDEKPNLPGASGALAKMEGFGPGQGGTLVYFCCDDCQENVAKVEEAGGKVLRPKFSIGEYGFIALVVDTEGNTIGLHSET